MYSSTDSDITTREDFAGASINSIHFDNHSTPNDDLTSDVKCFWTNLLVKVKISSYQNVSIVTGKPGSISLLYSRFFSPFPHGTGSLSVSGEYLALPDNPGKFIQDFPVTICCPALLRILLTNNNHTYTRLSLSMAHLSR